MDVLRHPFYNLVIEQKFCKLRAGFYILILIEDTKVAGIIVIILLYLFVICQLDSTRISRGGTIVCGIDDVVGVFF